MNKDAYYFPHDSNAKDDPKILILIEELGLEGYGIFWVLIETLRDQKEFKAPIRMLPAIARRYNTTTEKVKAVVMRYDLFYIEDDDFFFSESLIRRMEPLLEKKHHRKICGIKGNLIKYGYASKDDLDAMTDDEILRLNEEKKGVSVTDRLPTVERSHKKKVKESKVKESKLKEQAEEIYQAYPRKIGKGKAMDEITQSLKDEEFQFLMKRVQLFAESVEGKDRNYIPYPSTWFSQARYHDDETEWVAWKESDPNQKILTHPEMLELMHNPSHPAKSTDDFKMIRENGKVRWRYAG